MKAVQNEKSMFPQILDLAINLNRVNDLKRIFVAGRYKTFNLSSIVEILIHAKQYSLAMYVALIGFSQNVSTLVSLSSFSV